jgi:hypothetical protein
VVWYAKKRNKTPTSVGTRDTRKKNELMYGILNETKINMVTHVKRGQAFFFRGGGDLFLHWIWKDPIIFSFSHDQFKTFTFINTSVHPITKVTSKKKKPKTKIYLSGSRSFINYLFSIFWQWISLFSLWWRSNYLFWPKEMRIKIFI